MNIIIVNDKTLMDLNSFSKKYLSKLRGDKMKVFAKRLRQLRVEHNYNLDKLATMLNTTEATLSRYENNKSQPNIKQLMKMSEIFDCSNDYLLGKSDERISSEKLFSLYYEEGVELAKILDKFQVEYNSMKLSDQEKANIVKFMAMMRNL